MPVNSNSRQRASEVREAFLEPEWYFQKRGYHVRVRCETVQEMLGGATIERVLDIGCGDGSISLPLLRPNIHLTLLDMSDGMLRRARSRIPSEMADNVRIIKDDFMGAKVEFRAYDLVICLGVLAYVDELKAFTEKLASALKPGGLLILEWTDSDNLVNRILRPAHKLYGLLAGEMVHLASHSTAEVVASFRAAGFELGLSYRYCPPPPLLRRVLGAGLSYRWIRCLNGSVVRNRATWLGEECICCFARTAEEAAPAALTK